MEKFKKLGIGKNILKSIEEENFEKPSEIQEKTIPLVLEGKDIIAGSATGSGKTLAFGTGIIQATENKKGIQALVLTPTRELAEQVSEALIKFSKHKQLEVTPVYGGVSINPQIKKLETAEIVVGTPGRILDHISRGTLHLDNVKILVLDEADRMLDMGFIYDVEKIIRYCPVKRQTLLFSATIPIEVINLAQKYMKNPIEVSAESQVDPQKLSQVYYDIPDNMKFSLLVHLLKNEKSGIVMVFCNTQRNTDFVAKNLKFSGINALAIHGGFSQEKRTRTLNQFHSKETEVLVCTDVAARGLDIKGVSHVYNYDIPVESKQYIHRIGRTARAGKQGKAVNILASRDYENFSKVVQDNDINIPNEPTPKIDRVRIRWMESPRGSRSRFSRGRQRRDFRRSNRPNRVPRREGEKERKSPGRSFSREPNRFSRGRQRRDFRSIRSFSRGPGRDSRDRPRSRREGDRNQGRNQRQNSRRPRK